jgi:hypothetical protein
MHYRVNSKQDIFSTEPGLKGIPQFNACSSKELKYLFLAYDYEGPFRKLERAKRYKEAALSAGYKWLDGQGVFDTDGKNAIELKSVRMKKALDYFMNTIQIDDQDLETLDSYNEQLRQHNQFLARPNKKASEVSLAMKIQEKLPDLIAKRNKIAELVGHKINFKKEYDENKKMSTLDKLNAGLIPEISKTVKNKSNEGN